jgi:hypothetical protein
MTDFAKLEIGAREQFTLVTSVSLDENPLFFIKNYAATLVSSGAGSSSGSGHYYKYETLANSVGFYSYEWRYTISTNTFIERGRFELVQTLILESDLYCTETDVMNLYKPLADSDLRDHEITQFIKDVMHEVDAKLGPRYGVPFSTGVSSFPSLVETITKNLALTYIMESKPAAGEIPEWIKVRDDRYRSMLDAIAAGSMFLTLSGGAVLTPTLSTAVSGVDHNMENYAPTFNTLDVSRQQIDPDRQDDEEDAL